MCVSYCVNKNNEVWGERMMTNVHVDLPSKDIWNYRVTTTQQNDRFLCLFPPTLAPLMLNSEAQSIIFSKITIFVNAIYKNFYSKLMLIIHLKIYITDLFTVA
jgi:hypothetical protein